MSRLKAAADSSVQAVAAFHSFHSGKTWHPNQPGIEPWLRDSLVSLQGALQTIAQTQVKIAEQVDRNTDRLDRIERYLQSKG
ncbi:hypothetical protein ACFVWR_15410 [Leifsonia sp. NPDC058292]|uniref:hypothetical protein n=1 Tax=Leifsonia sp. NPDC058292 TaxID=3346428 RepID=UPI0036D7C4AC